MADCLTGAAFFNDEDDEYTRPLAKLHPCHGSVGLGRPPYYAMPLGRERTSLWTSHFSRAL